MQIKYAEKLNDDNNNVTKQNKIEQINLLTLDGDK